MYIHISSKFVADSRSVYYQCTIFLKFSNILSFQVLLYILYYFLYYVCLNMCNGYIRTTRIMYTVIASMTILLLVDLLHVQSIDFGYLCCWYNIL